MWAALYCNQSYPGVCIDRIYFCCIEEEFLNKFASTLQPGVIENELEQSILKLRWDMMEIEDKK